MNSLPKLIDDKQVRTKDVRAFLEKTYPKDSLPTVDEARALAAAHRAAMELFSKSGGRAARWVVRRNVENYRRRGAHRSPPLA